MTLTSLGLGAQMGLGRLMRARVRTTTRTAALILTARMLTTTERDTGSPRCARSRPPRVTTCRRHWSLPILNIAMMNSAANDVTDMLYARHAPMQLKAT